MKSIIGFIFCLIVFSYSFAENPSESNFPGGYVSIGLQFGKTQQNTQFIDVQITPSIVMIGPYKQNIQGYLFLGSSLGKRFIDGKSLSYFDLNINFWNGLFTFGTGRGIFFENGERYFRKKYWGGIGIIPLVLSRDYYIKNELEYKQKGLMGILPFPMFGNNFYP